MLPEAELRRVLPALPTRPVYGPWYRAVDYAVLQAVSVVAGRAR